MVKSEQYVTTKIDRIMDGDRMAEIYPAFKELGTKLSFEGDEVLIHTG